MKYRPYSILTPRFDPVSGGIRVMHGLYGWLLARGQIAYLNARMDIPFIGVYPEIYHGNNAQAQTVVRYILNKPGVMATGGTPGPTTFPSTDLIYGFTKLYDTFNLDNEHLMFLPIIDLHLFKDQKKKRTKRCVFVGKGVDPKIPETKGLTRISREMTLDQAGLADFLNKCDVMYSAENPSAMLEIARLCGCRVVFLPENAMTTYTKKELIEKYEPGMNGVSFGLEEEIKLETEAFREHYLGLRDIFSKKLDYFISETQKWRP